MTKSVKNLEIVARRDASGHSSWDHILEREPSSLLFQSAKWTDLLMAYLPDVEDFSLLAFFDGQLVGALPFLVSGKGPLGRVANSSPYYGSHGGFIIESSLTGADADSVRNALFVAWKEQSAALGLAGYTIVEPLEGAMQNQFWEKLDWDVLDQRTGFITPLADDNSRQNPEQAMMQRLHSKTRNMVRKGRKSVSDIKREETGTAYQFLQKTHEDNMNVMGGAAKEPRFFELARKYLDTRTYLAYVDQEPVAGLFLVRHNKVLEYFTPAVKSEFRSTQALSALIFQAMIDGVNEDILYWNWGGCWPSQTSLAQFKRRWGSKDKEYRYFVKLNQPLEDWQNLAAPGITKAYPYFYVLPFSMLEQS